MYVFIQIYPGRVVSIDWTVINNSHGLPTQTRLGIQLGHQSSDQRFRLETELYRIIQLHFVFKLYVE